MEDKEYIKKFIRKNQKGIKPDPKHIDYTNSLNILSNLDSRIRIICSEPHHKNHEHPLIYCWESSYDDNKDWFCGKCNTFYNINVCFFYCTACDYHLCQKCFLHYKVKDIELLSYGKINEECIKTHKLMPIYIWNNIKFPCNECNTIDYINNDSYCYFCSLCNYLICADCKNKAN